MQPVLFDTSVYITILRGQGDARLQFRQMASGAPIWLSAVVLEELYAGSNARSVRAVERLERDFERARRLLVPNMTDWAQTGKALARLAAKYDYERIGQGRLTNDALIAASAGRMGITVVTENAGDFVRLAEFLPFQRREMTPIQRLP
jgi:predicted nucleic acid-binding protein